MSDAAKLYPALSRADEERRIRALRELGALDTAREPIFNDLVSLAAEICGSAMAAISLVDSERQWFKACHGFDATETPRSHALCAYTILEDALLYVPDTRADLRLAQHPAVVGSDGVRFYAGVPLVGTHGERYGTLCVFDAAPRTLSPAQQNALQALARQAAAQFEARRARRWAEARDIAVQSLIEALPHGVVALGPDGRLRLLNETARNWFGEAYEGSRPCDWTTLGRVTDLRTGNELSADAYPVARAFRGEFVRDHEIRIETRDGRVVTMVCSAEPVALSGDQPSAAVFIGRPMAEPVLAEHQAGDLAALLPVLLNAVDEGVVVLDAEGCVVVMNQEAARLSGVSAGPTQGRFIGDVLPALAEAHVEFIRRAKWKTRESPKPEAGELRLRLDDESSVDVIYRALPIGASSAGARQTLLLLRDVTLTRGLTQALHTKAAVDPLTNVLSRAAIEAELGAALRETSAATYQGHLLYIDIDQFRVVNESCGHLAGDELLRRVATAMRTAMGGQGSLARLHGDEFVGILRTVGPDQALRIADDICRAVSASRFTWGSAKFALSVSIGVVAISPAASVDEVLGRALAVCELAKTEGRDRALLHDPTDLRLIEHRDRLNNRAWIQRAIDEKRFVLVGQRIERLTGEAGRPHVEVLLRLRGEDDELVPPAAFIDAAERYGLMPAVDRQVVATALGALSRCAPARRPLLAINLSGRTLADDSFADFVSAQFRAHAVEFSDVCFEITETSAISNMQHAEGFIERFRAKGCRFSLDDFGSGMSSFGYLKRLPIDFLKIDGGFIRNILSDRFDQAMVQAVQSVASATGMETIAEFVETAEIATYLAEIGVDYVQGYGVHRPEPLHEVLRFDARTRLW